MRRAFCYAVVCWFVFLIVGGLLFGKSSDLTAAERLALRADAALDGMEAPYFTAEAFDPFWTYEIAPYFQYEGLIFDEYQPPEVVFEPQTAGMEHNHLLGYTYCREQVFINIRVINDVSAWYGWGRNPLATLVHEMVHTLDGDFCSFNSEVAESTTQTATLEVLAALANGGNRVALYSLLLELRDGAMDVVLADALADDDLDGYREFRARVYPSALEEARFEKSLRFWASDMVYLEEILRKYSVLVLDNVWAGSMELYLPGSTGQPDTFVLDDLSYFLGHLKDIADDASDK